VSAYYNEIDPYAAQWLRNLIAAGHIAPGDVDERSIADVSPEDLKGFEQCHFFAGIGGWSLALRLAGWDDARPVWTGSCPCQPFSAAGKGEGFNDERHLWPAFFRLIRECRPASVFGEQVASNLAWLDLVSGDLEGEGYAVGSAIVGAHSVGAPHIRQRLYWVADAHGGQRGGRAVDGGGVIDGQARGWQEGHGEPAGRGATGERLADDTRSRRREERALAGGQPAREREEGRAAGLEQRGGAGERMAHPNPSGRSLERRSGLLDGERPALKDDADGCGADGGVGDAVEPRLEGLGRNGDDQARREDAHGSAWAASVLVVCADGRARPVPVEPGLFPLAHGVPGRVGRLRAYGNAIVPQLAAAFVMACQP
jgi:DNA (cytosine-5)-methyltransferase 1